VYIACNEGKVDVVKLFLDKGADIDMIHPMVREYDRENDMCFGETERERGQACNQPCS
jgi:hypothetical protein